MTKDRRPQSGDTGGSEVDDWSAVADIPLRNVMSVEELASYRPPEYAIHDRIQDHALRREVFGPRLREMLESDDALKRAWEARTRRPGPGAQHEDEARQPERRVLGPAQPTQGSAPGLPFFISHSGVDRDWAEWVAFHLQSNGHTIELDVWDWPAGANFIQEIDRASQRADRILIVLTENYLTGVYTQAEWQAALTTDPSGTRRRLLPVRVEPCQPRGLLAPMVYVDLVGLDEPAAIRALLEGVRAPRARPTSPPAFPRSSGR